MLIAKSLTLLTKAPKHWACNCNSPMDWLRLVSVRGADHQRTDFGQLLQLKANDQALGSVYPTVKNVFGSVSPRCLSNSSCSADVRNNTDAVEPKCVCGTLLPRHTKLNRIPTLLSNDGPHTAKSLRILPARMSYSHIILWHYSTGKLCDSQLD